MENEQPTLSRIHAAARAEFLEKGFRGASLRHIVKMAGVSTGAFYGYYKSKEALFEALVDEPAQTLLGRFSDTIDEFLTFDTVVQTEEMATVSQRETLALLDYMYANKEAFKLILTAAEGTRYADFVHRFVEKESESTYAYMENLRKAGHAVPPVNDKVIHMVESGLFYGIFETIVHDMPQEEARAYVKDLMAFYTAGWEKLFNVHFGK